MYVLIGTVVIGAVAMGGVGAAVYFITRRN
jgi:hypothetical protein